MGRDLERLQKFWAPEVAPEFEEPPELEWRVETGRSLLVGAHRQSGKESALWPNPDGSMDVDLAKFGPPAFTLWRSTRCATTAPSSRGVLMPWLPTSACVPPHRVSHPEKAQQLVEAFEAGGWAPDEPALLGYPWEGTIQLLSGHRWAAADAVGIMVPVWIVEPELVGTNWGNLEAWLELMASAPKARFLLLSRT